VTSLPKLHSNGLTADYVIIYVFILNGSHTLTGSLRKRRCVFGTTISLPTSMPWLPWTLHAVLDGT
jgi:hypothetical protein